MGGMDLDHLEACGDRPTSGTHEVLDDVCDFRGGQRVWRRESVVWNLAWADCLPTAFFGCER
ncbi:MAG: hypothetical protein EBS70_00585 [Actinobacteria bacterium]|nr:hypothetical protein [Actinomycetota bacterium]